MTPPGLPFRVGIRLRFKYRPRCGPAITTVCTMIQSLLQSALTRSQHCVKSQHCDKLPSGHHQLSAFSSQDRISGAQISSILPEWLYSAVRIP